MCQNALQFVEGAVANHQLPFTLGSVLDLHGRAQTLCELLLQATDVRVGLGCNRRRFGAQPLAYQGFGLTNGQATCDNMSRRFDLLFQGSTEQGAGMAHLQVAMGE